MRYFSWEIRGRSGSSLLADVQRVSLRVIHTMGVGKEKIHRIPSNRLYRVCKRVQCFFLSLKSTCEQHFENERITTRMIVWKTNIIFTLEMRRVSVSFRSKLSCERILNIFIDEWSHIVYYTVASGANCKHIKSVRHRELRLWYSKRARLQPDYQNSKYNRKIRMK